MVFYFKVSGTETREKVASVGDDPNVIATSTAAVAGSRIVSLRISNLSFPFLSILFLSLSLSLFCVLFMSLLYFSAFFATIPFSLFSAAVVSSVDPRHPLSSLFFPISSV